MDDNLDDFLKQDEPAATTETEAAPAEAVVEPAPEAPAEPAKAERPRGPDGKFLPKGEDEPAPPAEQETQHSIPPKALQEERRKRQELEVELQRLREAQQPQQPAPDIWENTEGWQQHFGGQVVSEAVQAATMNARLDMSEMMVRQSQPDFEDKKATFLELMRDTPGLQQKALADPHPWNFAYNYVANHERMNQLSATNVTELEAKLREQIKAELAAEQKPATLTPSIPDSLAGEQSARGSSTSAVTVPTLDQILGRST